MSTDDTIRAILRAEADDVDPSPAGWDAIKNGIAVRRRRTWWLRGSAFAGAVATVVAVALVTNDSGPHSVGQVPITSLSPSAPVLSDVPLGAIWPLTTTGELRAWNADHTTYPALETAEGAALAFAHTYLGIADASVATAPSGLIVVTRPVAGSSLKVTELGMVGFGRGGGAPWVVTLALGADMGIDTPVPEAAVTSPLAVHGTYRAVEPSFVVTVRADTSATVPDDLASARATTGPPDVWDVTLPFTTTARTGSLLVTNASLVDGGLASATAIPLTFP